MSAPLDLSKHVQTRDGRKVRNVGRFKAGRFSGVRVENPPVDGIFGVVIENDGTERVDEWLADGSCPQFPGYSPADLVNVPEPGKTVEVSEIDKLRDRVRALEWSVNCLQQRIIGLMSIG